MYGDLPLLYCACMCSYVGVAISLGNQHSSLWNIAIVKRICRLLALDCSTINRRLLGGVYNIIYTYLHHRLGLTQHDAAFSATCVRNLCAVMQVAVIAASCCVGPGLWWW